MTFISHGFGASHAQSRVAAKTLKRAMFDMVIQCLEKGSVEKLSVPTIDGRYLCISCSIEISIPEMNRTGGDDKA